MKARNGTLSRRSEQGYEVVLTDVVRLVETARSAAVRSVNVVMTATYWAVGRRIVEHEQAGAERAGYGEELLEKLAKDLKAKVGRGFSVSNLEQMRRFYLTWPIPQTASGKSLTATGEAGPISQTASGISPDPGRPAFPLPWSHYVRLLSVAKPEARRFYEAGALRGGWTVRQLERQIESQFYERTALSRNKEAMLRKGHLKTPEDAVTAEEEIPVGLILCATKDTAVARYARGAFEQGARRHLPYHSSTGERAHRTDREGHEALRDDSREPEARPQEDPRLSLSEDVRNNTGRNDRHSSPLTRPTTASADRILADLAAAARAMAS